MNTDFFIGEKSPKFSQELLEDWKLFVSTNKFPVVLSYFSNSCSGKQIKEAIEKNYIPYDFYFKRPTEEISYSSFEVPEKLKKIIFG